MGSKSQAKMELATLGAGCFWCVEAIFQRLAGVESVSSGYAGGSKPNPTYKEVCNGTTGHAEVCQIRFNPEIISFTELLEVFWQTHDPTTLNRQGGDVGTQYRSVIFFHSESQEKIAKELIREINENKTFNHPVVTEVAPYTSFYAAEDYHQDYFNLNGSQPYCEMVVKPKVDKFRKLFKDRLQN